MGAESFVFCIPAAGSFLAGNGAFQFFDGPAVGFLETKGLGGGLLAFNSAPDLLMAFAAFKVSIRFSPKRNVSTFVFCSCSFISFFKEESMKLRLVTESLY